MVWVPGGLLQVAGQSSVFSYSLVPWRIESLNEVLLIYSREEVRAEPQVSLDKDWKLI